MMIKAKLRFVAEIDKIKSFGSLLSHMNQTGYSEQSHYDDVMRLQLVLAIGAFDKLIHDLVRIGIIRMFRGEQAPTKKYLNESIPISVVINISNQDLITASVQFKQAIYGKLKIASYQDPVKVAEGLSFIWDEKQKWDKLAEKIGYGKGEDIRSRLSLISSRRNAIVHESDFNPDTHTKNEVLNNDIVDSINFLEKLGLSIFDLVVHNQH